MRGEAFLSDLDASQADPLRSLLTRWRDDPLGTYQIVWWDSKSASNEDGEPGAWVACNKGAQYSEIQGVEPSISKGTTLSCFGPSGRPPT